MFKYFAKKYVLSLINKALEDISKGKNIDAKLQKARQIADISVTICKALEDKKIDDKEADQIVDEISALF